MEEDPDVITELQQKKADLDVRCKEMEDKLFEQQMDTAFREYQDDMWEEINRFSCALGAYRKDLAVDKNVVEARRKLQLLCEM